MASPTEPIMIEHYSNRRRYRPAAGSYVALGNLAGMVADEEDFAVCDAQTGEDITGSILQQTISGRAHHG